MDEIPISMALRVRALERFSVVALSIAIPFHDDPEEAFDMVERARSQLSREWEVEYILVSLDPTWIASDDGNLLSQKSSKLIRCSCYQGLPMGKNLALHASSGEFLLFLYPGHIPNRRAIERLLNQLVAHESWGAVAGRWNDEFGRVEQGYNVRRFPTFAALLLDVLLLNKLLPFNGITRRYKMHDFDHDALREVDHANDCVFMARRKPLLDLGGFDESYGFGWFDQVEMCRKLKQVGHPVYYEPEAVFTSAGRETLINRLLESHYVDYYQDVLTFVERSFGPRKARLMAAAVFLGMLVRLSFCSLLPAGIRNRLLRRFRSYVDDRYIQRMRATYISMLRTLLNTGFERRLGT